MKRSYFRSKSFNYFRKIYEYLINRMPQDEISFIYEKGRSSIGYTTAYLKITSKGHKISFTS